MSRVFLLCFFVHLLYRHANSYSTGPPRSVCTSMTPGKAAHGNAETSDAPYVIQINKSYYHNDMDGTVEVSLKACDKRTIGGFLIEAREKGKAVPLGNFVTIPPKAKYLDCTRSANAESEKSAVSHKEKMDTDMVTLEWQPNQNTTGDIYFMATIVESKHVFWVGVKSSIMMKNKTDDMYNFAPDNQECSVSAGGSVAVNVLSLVLALSVQHFI